MKQEIEESLDVFYNKLAIEISKRKIFNITEIRMLLKLRSIDAFKIYVNDFVSMEENLYNKEVSKGQKMMKDKNAAEYILQGFKIRKAKERLKNANRHRNNERKYKEYTALKDYVCEKFGKDVLSEFLSTQNLEKVQPIYSTDK